MSDMSTKLQATAGAAVLAVGLAITPAVAHAAPSLAPFSTNVGNSAELLIDPVVIVDTPGTPGSNKTATANASVPETFIAGISEGLTNFTKGFIQYWGSWVYGAVGLTGAVVSLVLPGLGAAITEFANNIARAIKIGPYSTAT